MLFIYCWLARVTSCSFPLIICLFNGFTTSPIAFLAVSPSHPKKIEINTRSVATKELLETCLRAILIKSYELQQFPGRLRHIVVFEENDQMNWSELRIARRLELCWCLGAQSLDLEGKCEPKRFALEKLLMLEMNFLNFVWFPQILTEIRKKTF